MPNVLITGCSSGFGELTALALARRGDRVYATVRRPAAEQALKERADAEKLELSVHLLDVTDANAVERTVAQIAELGAIDVLVNNAGFAVRGPIESLADDEILRQFDTNVFGVVRMIRAVVPSMRAHGRGSIINLSSIAGLIGVPFEGAYAASKHALEGLSEALRFELADAGISVMLIEPGAYETGFVPNITEARAFTTQHPGRPAYERFAQALEEGVHAAGRADPQQVVDAILDAVDHPDGPFRRLVGNDAELVARLKREGSFEDFEAGIQTTMGIRAGG